MSIQNLLAAYKSRQPQGVPPLLQQTQPPAIPTSYGEGDPPMRVVASAEPIAGQPNPNAFQGDAITVSNSGYPDPLTPKEHKGMFGIKGTWRDVLGGIGDSLLIGTGGQAIYRPIRDREKIGDITANFTNDPELTIQQLHQNGYPEVAAEYEKRYAEAQAQEAEANRWQSEYDLDVAEDNRKQVEYENKVFGTGLTLMASATDQASWTRARTKVLAYWERAAPGKPFPFDIPETYDPNFRNDIANFGAEGMFEVTKENNDVAYGNQQIVVRREAIAAQRAANAARLSAQVERDTQTAADRKADRDERKRKGDADRTSRENIAAADREERSSRGNRRRPRGGPPSVEPAKK